MYKSILAEFYGLHLLFSFTSLVCWLCVQLPWSLKFLVFFQSTAAAAEYSLATVCCLFRLLVSDTLKVRLASCSRTNLGPLWVYSTETRQQEVSRYRTYYCIFTTVTYWTFDSLLFFFFRLLEIITSYYKIMLIRVYLVLWILGLHQSLASARIRHFFQIRQKSASAQNFTRAGC